MEQLRFTYAATGDVESEAFSLQISLHGVGMYEEDLTVVRQITTVRIRTSIVLTR